MRRVGLSLDCLESTIKNKKSEAFRVMSTVLPGQLLPLLADGLSAGTTVNAYPAATLNRNLNVHKSRLKISESNGPMRSCHSRQGGA